MPALEDGAVTLYESTAIVEYLEDRYPERPLLPAEPAARALARIEELECMEYFWDALGPVARQMFFTPPERRDAAALDEGRAAVRAEMARLNGRAVARGGDFVAGARLVRADLAWLPFLELAARAGVDVDAAATPWVAGWRARMRARPSYTASYPPHWREGQLR